jgi:hypothetical protein
LKIREETNEIKTKKIQSREKSWFFEKINNIGKSIAKVTKRRRKTTHINKIINEKGNYQNK